tara:strand:- start:245 stop:541 length:297 start_codon:yes stop_codon:yes gene_type:complete
MSFIVPGYNGIMDLDLTNVDKRLHSVMIEQHEKDIKDYKIEQSKLPKRLRYENTIVKANKVIEMDSMIMKRKQEIFLEKQRLEDEDRYKRFINSQSSQ